MIYLFKNKRETNIFIYIIYIILYYTDSYIIFLEIPVPSPIFLLLKHHEIGLVSVEVELK